ncbi:hypothetical protein CRE_12429 [Caenorhabditis remanei]|uniref:Calpain catalytic domain-containing protein n=1 Tax=Caenorhabditis remanei TaxID=31234 RepID=E3NRK6_CAERE|nr:hypothetical protein CRE_12429 [Caenorhabditis remanei]
MTFYEDPEFPIKGNSKRPHDLVAFPKFFGLNFNTSRRDDWRTHFERRTEINGTHAGFFLVAVSSLTKDLISFHKIVEEQSFDEREYTGKFHFKFYDESRQLKTIEIDDRLPIKPCGALQYAQKVGDVFWYPLMEKAYAKFCGGYEQIETGLLIKSMFHLTGRNPEWFDNGAESCLPFNAEGIYSNLRNLIEKKIILVCKLRNPEENNQAYGSGFTIIDVTEKRRISNDGFPEPRKFVQLRHPSGKIPESMMADMGIYELTSLGEGLMDTEKFVNQMQCVYSVDMSMHQLRRSPGLDAFIPFIPEEENPRVNYHRAKH